MASAMSSPAPPLIQMAGSSSDPCPTTNSVRGKSIPARRQAAEMAPSIRPLKTSSHTVPMPNVRPSPQVKSETLILLTAIALLAAGAAPVSDSVQSRFDCDGRPHRRAHEETLEHGVERGQNESQDRAGPEKARGQQDRPGGLAHAHRPGLAPELRPAS